MGKMPNIFPEYKKFDLEPEAKNIRQIYATIDNCNWIKEKALAKGIKMVSVIEALVKHAESSEKAFTLLMDTVLELDTVIDLNDCAINAELSPECIEFIQHLKETEVDERKE